MVTMNSWPTRLLDLLPTDVARLAELAKLAELRKLAESSERTASGQGDQGRSRGYRVLDLEDAPRRGLAPKDEQGALITSAIRGGDSSWAVHGYVTLWERVSSGPLYEDYRVMLRPGAFARSLQSGRCIPMVAAHSAWLALGYKNPRVWEVESGRLHLEEDGLGLWFVLIGPGEGWIEAVEAGRLSQCSYRARYREWDFATGADGERIVAVSEAELLEVSLVKEGAFRGAYARPIRFNRPMLAGR